MKTIYSNITPYKTKDGSQIRELLHPLHHSIKNQSLAEATVPPNSSTNLHKHHQSEEVYHITAGEGWMQLGDKEFKVEAGTASAFHPKSP